MPVKAAALARASAKGMVSGEKYFLSIISTQMNNKKKLLKNSNC